MECLKWKYHTPLLCSLPNIAHRPHAVYVDKARSIIVMANRGGQESQALMNYLLARVKEECKPAIYSHFISLMNAYHGNM